jgi:hypothetical protein
MLILKRKGWVPDAVNPTNLLTKNQSDVETNTTGFGPASGGVISRDTTEKWEGESSLKVVTNGAQAYQGTYLLDTAVTPSQTHKAMAHIKGVGTIVMSLAELDAASGAIGQSDSVAITLSDQWQKIIVTRTFGALGVKARMKIQTNSAQVATFYVDGLMLAKDAGRWVPGQTRRVRRTLIL